MDTTQNPIVQIYKEVMAYINNGILCSPKKNNKLMQFKETLIELESIMLIEISQGRKNTVCSHLVVVSIME